MPILIFIGQPLSSAVLSGFPVRRDQGAGTLDCMAVVGKPDNDVRG
jgi:hypothetical protein